MEIVHLPRKQWKDAVLPMRYTADAVYDAHADCTERGFSFSFTRTALDAPVTHGPEEHDFPDRLYADWQPGAWAWGVVEDGALRAAIETAPEEWSNRLRITELWVDEPLRGHGLGHALMDHAREQARLERRRGLVLETQSCNVPAIGFYLREGFRPVGCDLSAYSNRDPARREVRVEMGLPLTRPAPVGDRLILRPETPADRQAAEEMTRRAFWNKHHPGCNEHLLIRRLRDDPAFVPELTRVAELDGRIVGGIWFARARLRRSAHTREILTFGPLAVEPALHGCGVGAALLRATLPEARRMGFPGVVIYGEPDYYPRHGFQTCDKLGVTTPEGRNFDAFMGYELTPGGLSGFGGAFYEPAVCEALTDDELAAIEPDFPPMDRRRFPKQWTSQEED